jgi:hypothetical protein
MSLGAAYDTRWRLAMFGLSLLLAAAIYHLIEEPVRTRRVLSAPRSLMRGYAGVLVTTLAIVAAVHVTGGLPARFPDEVSRLAAHVDDRPPPLTECEYFGKALTRVADFCAIGSRDRPARWLVYGDSHAWAAHAGFDRWLRDKGEAGLFIFRHSCPPVVGVFLAGERGGGCHAFNDAVAAYLERTPAIAAVVLVSSW